jgi:hypothetical protein
MDTNSQIIAPVVEDIALTAMHPAEMIASQEQLIIWAERKIVLVRQEETELSEAYEHAKKLKWKSGTLHTQHLKAVKRREFYEKILEALKQGYYIVPNFPIQMFAIKRRGRGRPSSWSPNYHDDHEQEAQAIPVGEGEYKNPFPFVSRYRDDSGNKVITSSRAEDWDDMEFPVTMAKPTIMRATSAAMERKIFDRIGVMPATRKEDPVIIGQIIRKDGNNTKVVSFMIAWHLNTNVL